MKPAMLSDHAFEKNFGFNRDSIFHASIGDDGVIRAVYSDTAFCQYKEIPGLGLREFASAAGLTLVGNSEAYASDKFDEALPSEGWKGDWARATVHMVSRDGRATFGSQYAPESVTNALRPGRFLMQHKPDYNVAAAL